MESNSWVHVVPCPPPTSYGRAPEVLGSLPGGSSVDERGHIGRQSIRAVARFHQVPFITAPLSKFVERYCAAIFRSLVFAEITNDRAGRVPGRGWQPLKAFHATKD